MRLLIERLKNYLFEWVINCSRVQQITRNRATLIFHNDHFQVGTAFRVEGKFQYRSRTSLKCLSIVVPCNSVQSGFDSCACIGKIELKSTSMNYSQIHRDLSSWWSSENLNKANFFLNTYIGRVFIEGKQHTDKNFSRLQVTACSIEVLDRLTPFHET